MEAIRKAIALVVVGVALTVVGASFVDGHDRLAAAPMIDGHDRLGATPYVDGHDRLAWTTFIAHDRMG